MLIISLKALGPRSHPGYSKHFLISPALNGPQSGAIFFAPDCGYCQLLKRQQVGNDLQLRASAGQGCPVRDAQPK